MADVDVDAAEVHVHRGALVVGTSSSGMLRSFPPSIKFVVWNEFCERFCYYGMKAILALYCLQRVRLTENESTEVVHMFMVACYATPLIGAAISDGFLGKYRTILYLSMVYALGNWAMALAAWPDPDNVNTQYIFWGSVVALLLIAFGTGGIKPCVSAFGGDQIEYTVEEGPRKLLLRRRFFSLFYAAINAGSVISTVLTPILRAHVSYSVAFAVPAFLMLVAISIFFLGRNTYVNQPPQGNVFASVGSIIVDAVRLRTTRGRDGDGEESSVEQKLIARSQEHHWLDAAKTEHPAPDVEDVKAVLRVLIALLPTPLFWSLSDQSSSTWIFQGASMNGRVVGNIVIEPDQMQALNPVLVLLMIPLFDQVIYPFFENRRISLLPLRRMTIGLFFSALAFVISGVIQIVIDRNEAAGSGKISILWQTIPYVVVTAGEIMFSISGLEFAYAEAPDSMKSVVQSIWLFTVAVGNLITVIIVAIVGGRLSKAKEFFFFSIVCLVAVLLMYWVGAKYVYKRQAADSGERSALHYRSPES